VSAAPHIDVAPDVRAALRGRRVCVAGRARAGDSAAEALADLGALVTVADRSDGTDTAPPAGTELVVTSPGWRPDQPLLAAAVDAGIPVWGDVELAWRLRRSGVPWLGGTGTNGKTTTAQMLEAMLRAAGLRTVACGNIGLPVLDAVLAEEPYDVLAVEVSSFQLHWTSTVEFAAGAVLNIAPDHLDWHGSLTAYAAAKAAVWRGDGCVVHNADDPLVTELAAQASAGREQRRIGFTLGEPAAGQLGVVGGAGRDLAGGRLVDRSRVCSASPLEAEHTRGETPAPSPGTGDATEVLAEVAEVRPPGPHNVANALAAGALARTLAEDGQRLVSADHVRAGLRAFTPGGHRIATVGTRAGVAYVDDSKATNPHAAAASLTAFDRVVWIAGGLAKGARFEEVVSAARSRLRAAVLLGQDRALVAEALARHAPEIPVVEVERTDTGAMDDVVRAAAALARPGDTVLLAPACASMDMFSDYAARGDAFAAAVGRLGQ